MLKLIMWLFMPAKNTPRSDFKTPSSTSNPPSNTMKCIKP